VEVYFETGFIRVKAIRRGSGRRIREVIIDMGEIYCDIVQNWSRIRLLGRIRQNGIWKV
jgi:hypothetical protein